MSSPVTRAVRPRLLCAVFVFSHVALAAEPDCTTINRKNLVACAEAHSPLLGAALGSVRAAEGRREAARPFLPANPFVSGTFSARNGPDAKALNWSVTVAQELELAGQSGLRVDAADRELAARGHEAAVVRADIAERAWRAWFDALAGKERVALASRIEQSCLAVSKTASGFATQGLASPIDAAVADAVAVRAGRARLDAQRDAATAEVRLRTLLGNVGRVELEGELEPLNAPGNEVMRPELLALEAQHRASAARVELMRRSVVPNATVSLFAQNDGFDEKVFGGGLAVPIPLPVPLGRYREGQESVGQAARAQSELENATRTLDSEKELARAEFQSALESRQFFTVERVTRAREGLGAIEQQVAAARLSVREALADQLVLIELLQSALDARHTLCAASVRLVRASGGSLEVSQ